MWMQIAAAATAASDKGRRNRERGRECEGDYDDCSVFRIKT
jgi:hypothetical protein